MPLAHAPADTVSSLLTQGPGIASLDDPDAVAARLRPLLDAPLLCFKGPAFSRRTFDGWNAVVERLGTWVNDGENSATGEKDGTVWIDVRYDPAHAGTFRHSATAQPLHTDSAYNAEPVEYVFFLCEHQAKRGGETIFVSAETVDLVAREAAPELHKRMWELPLSYGKAGHRGRSVPVLRRDDKGLLINWNYFRVLEETQAIATFRQQFAAFLEEEIVGKGRATPLQMQPGDVAFFQDQRLLHGRFSFAPSPRCIWKCNFNRSSS